MKLTGLVGPLAACALVAGCAGSGERDAGLESGKSPADLYVALAAEYYRMGDMETALLNAQKAIDKDSKSASAHNVMATIYQQLDRNDLAEKHFQTALRLAPNDPFARTAWGNFLCEQGRYAQADAEFAKALAEPLFSAPWLALSSAGACARREGNSGKAEDYLRRALTANPRYFPALLEMAELDYDNGRHKSAQGYLKRYFAVRGQTPRALLLASRVERKLGSSKRARAYAKTLRQNFPDAPEVVYLNES
jgi:type IV pilus assembly protein PilF